MLNKTNKYDKMIFLLIAVLCFGNIGGSLQISRLLAVVLSPILLSRMKYCTYSRELSVVYICFLFYCVLSMLWTPDTTEGLKDFIYFIVHGLLFFEILVFSKFAKKPLESLSWGWTISVLLCSIVALWEINTGNHLSIAKDQSSMHNFGVGNIIEANAASVTFFNYNSCVTFLCFSLPWIIYRAFTPSSGVLGKLISIVTLLIGCFVIINNASRGGLITMVLMIAAVAFKSFGKVKVVLGIVILVILTIYLLINFGSEFTALIIARTANGGLLDGSSRTEVWGDALAVFFNSFGFGVGVGGMQAALTEYRPNGLPITHNMFLEVLVQYGLVFFCAFVYFLYRAFLRSFRNRNTFHGFIALVALLVMPVYGIIDSGYLLSAHLYGLLGTIYVFSYYERIKYSGKVLRSTT